jgi:hypothetical protein
MMSLVFAFVLVALFIGFEGPARKGKEAKTLDWGKSDLGTTKLLAIAFAIPVLVLVGAVVLDYLQIGAFDSNQFISWIGVSVMLLRRSHYETADPHTRNDENGDGRSFKAYVLNMNVHFLPVEAWQPKKRPTC